MEPKKMSANNLDKLASLITQEHEALLASWREQVRQLPCAAHLDTPTLNDHIPGLLGELAAALKARSEQTIPEALCEGTPPAHGAQRVQDGFDIEERFLWLEGFLSVALRSKMRALRLSRY
jgi:two-component system phosphate regulon sensor histidine kinase PhoR